VTLLLNSELVSRVKLCLFSVFPDIVKDCTKIRNQPKKLQECGPAVLAVLMRWIDTACNVCSGTTYRFRVMALYSDNDSLQGPARKFTLHTSRPQSPATAPLILKQTALSEHAVSLLWRWQVCQ